MYFYFYFTGNELKCTLPYYIGLETKKLVVLTVSILEWICKYKHMFMTVFVSVNLGWHELLWHFWNDCLQNMCTPWQGIRKKFQSLFKVPHMCVIWELSKPIAFKKTSHQARSFWIWGGSILDLNDDEFRSSINLPLTTTQRSTNTLQV